MRLRAILDQRDAALARDPAEAIDVGHAPVEMRDDDRARARRSAAASAAGSICSVDGVDLHVGGCRARRADRRRRVHAGVRHRRDRVARTDGERAQRELERIGAVADGDALGGADVRREFALEGLDFRPEDVPAASVDPRHRRFELRAQRRVMPREIVERDHARQPAAARPRAQTSFQSL